MSQFKIYPPIGIARLGNAKADKDDVVFSPEVPWANLYETEQNYRTPEGKLKKQAQRFYIYECDDNGRPVRPVSTDDYDIEWTAEVANKKAFWYDFNNSLDLSVQIDNHNNLSSNFYNDAIAPGISASYRNPNVLNESLRIPDGDNIREELVNSPAPVSVSAAATKREIVGAFPFTKNGHSQIAASMNINSQPVTLGTMEYDDGTLIFYGADGISASLNPSDLNTDFADNSNWYDDICDGRITAKLTPKTGGDPIYIDDASSAAWVASTPPDYAPQIQPISTLFDLIMGAGDDSYSTDFSTVFPVLYRLYRMQWVNLGDFLSPSLKEAIDQIISNHQFHYLYSNDGSTTAYEVRNSIFSLFRNPEYNYTNEPIIPSKETTDLANRNSGTEDLKLPSYPGDGINYPGSPAQWFAIPPLLYQQLQQWRDGHFTPLAGNYCDMDAIGLYYQQQFIQAAEDDSKKPLLMTRAILETLYGGGFHPGVELTWPMRHAQMYAENTLLYPEVTADANLFGLREVRINAVSKDQQSEIFYNDFGLEINPQDVANSLSTDSPNAWFWQASPGDLTKWMGIPWQSDAGSCQAVFTDSQYPVPAWWAANLPVDVLTEDSLVKMQDAAVLPETKQRVYANRLPWLKTTDTGFVGYHAEGGYMNGLISMVYQWKDIGVVTGRKTSYDGTTPPAGIPDTVYVSFDGRNQKDKTSIFLGKAIAGRPVNQPGATFYSNTRDTVWIPENKQLVLSANPDGTGSIYVDDQVVLSVNGKPVYTYDYSNSCSYISSQPPTDITDALAEYIGHFVNITIEYQDVCGGSESSTGFYLVFK